MFIVENVNIRPRAAMLRGNYIICNTIQCHISYVILTMVFYLFLICFILLAATFLTRLYRFYINYEGCDTKWIR